MKQIKSILILTLFFWAVSIYTQSNITYEASTQIDVGSGADICSDAIIINGTWSGTGTICLGPLPVSISSFTYSINKREVSLNWITEWELNNSGFEVERKANKSGEWIKIAFISGNGTTNEQKRYSYTDKKLNTGTYQYRLKQVDFNGGMNISA